MKRVDRGKLDFTRTTSLGLYSLLSFDLSSLHSGIEDPGHLPVSLARTLLTPFSFSLSWSNFVTSPLMGFHTQPRRIILETAFMGGVPQVIHTVVPSQP